MITLRTTRIFEGSGAFGILPQYNADKLRRANVTNAIGMGIMGLIYVGSGEPLFCSGFMSYTDLPSFLRTIGMALRLQPEVFSAVQSDPAGIWVALAVVAAAGFSEATGQSVMLFLNHIRPARFGLALAIATASHFLGYLVWTLTIWLAGGALFGQDQPLLAVASAVGLSYAPQIFSFFVLTPYLGNLFGVILSLWSMAAVIIAVRVGLRLELWQAVVLAITGWALLQTMRRTVGLPVMRLQRRLASRAAGVTLELGAKDLRRVRRRRTRNWYRQLESWRRPPGKRAAPAEVPPVAPVVPPVAPEGQPRIGV